MNTITGLFGIAGIWLTMAMVPLIELLGLTAGEATFLRGLSGVVAIGAASLWLRGLVTKPDKETVRIAVLFTLATVCLFQAVTAWGANFSALFLDMALFVPLYFLWRSGQRISAVTIVAIVAALFGTLLALRIFDGGALSLAGLVFSLGALLFNGLFIQYAGKATQANWNKAFWMSLGLLAASLPTVSSGGLITSGAVLSPIFVALVLLFSIATGMLNFYSAFTAFKHLSPVTVGVLILGVTPTIMLSSYLMLGRGMGIDQLVGVGITLVSVLLFGYTIRKDSTQN
jgi:drug/metabolite transporter (DMT)-like permease